MFGADAANPGLWLLLVLAVLALALAMIGWLGHRRGQALQIRLARLETEFDAQLEQAQRDLLAMGQRVMESEKRARRLVERLDALESARPAAERYGQLGELLAGQAQLREDNEASPISTAEAELRLLLRRAPEGLAKEQR